MSEPSDESLALLARLSSKPGVQSTLVLDRADGTILRSSGLLARGGRAQRPSSSDSNWGSSGAAALSTPSKTGANGAAGSPPPSRRAAEGQDGGAGEVDAEGQTGEEVARTVWRFVQAAGTLVRELDDEDELRLLRVRTRKNELVVVPNAKFLLVVVHDTPAA